MPLMILADKTGVSKTVTDKDMLDYLEDVNAFYGRDAYEIEEFTKVEKGFFRKPETHLTYRVFYDCGGEWQVMQCASGDEKVTKAFLLGLINGIHDGIKGLK